MKMTMFDSSFNRHHRHHNLLISVLLVVVSSFVVFAVYQAVNGYIKFVVYDARVTLDGPSQWEEVVISNNVGNNIQVTPTIPRCHYYNCFNVYRCGRAGSQKISVYVYPLVHYVDESHVSINTMSRQFVEVIDTIINSEYYTSDPEAACIFVPTIDTLNENSLRKEKIAQILAMLPYWSGGENHLLMNLLPGTPPDFHTTFGVDRGRAIIAGGGFSSLTYRRSFDISLPVYNPSYQHIPVNKTPVLSRKWLVISSQTNIHREYRDDLEAQVSSSSFDLLLLDLCRPFTNLTQRCNGTKSFSYPYILTEGKFCLVVRAGRLGQTTLYDAMRAGCVPIIVADGYILPFSEVIDWRTAAVLLYEEDLPDLLTIIKRDVSMERLVQMQKKVMWIYKSYFATIKDITLTTLKILNDRVFPVHSRSSQQWNESPISQPINNPLFLSITAPKHEGFTAIILTYDRIESLFQVIHNLAEVPSLAKIVVVWNNQMKTPPSASLWPKVNVPLKVVQTKENKLSNRFYPYEEIETECILALDDDINMMTLDELEFGYQVWREFPDRIVGFPSRNVVWNNVTRSWKYDSEWTNEVSMVLTGVAFYHKYWSYIYTTQMPGNIKEWVDDHMNCEDIAMNFLVANLTGNSPIKVTPRKKFKCGECTSGDLSANEAHLVERSHCVNHFTQLFGAMPLKTVEFRADPVLYMDNLPDKLKLYSNMGSL